MIDKRFELQGLLSHLADSEALDSQRTSSQCEVFLEAQSAVKAALSSSPTLRHIANSAAALHHKNTHATLVRSGLALYGIDPADREDGLRPVMSVRARIVQVREIEPGETVGYGGGWTASRLSRIGVAPVGYADGYSWRLANKASALVGGRRVPVVGAVSMDMVTIDLTGTEAGVGTEVTLLGRDGDETITAWELARLRGTVPYEVLCHFGLRLPKRFRGRVVDLSSP